MSLTSAINSSRSALAASQLGIQVASNNIANLATPGYSRQVLGLAPMPGDRSMQGISVGRGVLVRDVSRQVDTALQARLWLSTADSAGADAQRRVLAQLESTLGELGDNDLSSELSAFFRSWSERANQTRSEGAVVEQGVRLTEFMRRLRSDLVNQRAQIDGQLGSAAGRADQILSQVAELNVQIADAEVAGQVANTLRDQRDELVTQLSGMLDVSVVDRGREGFDILVGSTPVVLGGLSRGVELRRENLPGGGTRVRLSVKADGTELDVTSGEIGGLLGGRLGAIDETVDKIDELAGRMIFEINRLHGTGTNLRGLRETTGFVQFPLGQRGVALNDGANTTMQGLPVRPTNGSFLVHVRDSASGALQTVRVPVDLDGINASGQPGTADDTSAEDLVNALNAIPGLSASFTPDGRLSVRAADGKDFSFAEDSSGAVAALGLNAYFTGTNAANISVRSDLTSDPSGLTAGRMVNGQVVENATALEIAGLQTRGIEALGGRSIPELWRSTVQGVGTQAGSARSLAQAAEVVRDSLEAQRLSVSGVSIDEESINLLNFQKQYQGAARVISVADQLTQTLLSLV
jgi:flagellar hook-associated protein 1 FlgK